MDIKKKIKDLPNTCGVYVMKSARGKVLYVGKATSLKKRVLSYFSPSVSTKTSLLVDEAADIEYILCDSPQQALILEAALIKERKPKYNISLRDGKSYPYIEVTREKFPRISISRFKARNKNIFFGPYPNAGALKSAIEMIRKVFPYCSCKRSCSASYDKGKLKSPCLYYHLSLCPAPCAQKISQYEYKENISNICKILKGERKKLVGKLKKKMASLSKLKKYEAAAKIRDKISAIEALYKGKPKEHAILSLKEALGLGRVPLIIEAIDVSSLGDYDAVGSVVVFKDGVADKRNYRRFRIKGVRGVDDYAMMAEIVKRRYSRILIEKKEFPDLLVIDGGKGHVVRAAEVLTNLDISIELIGLAKQHEEIWFPDKEEPLCISRDKPCLHLLQSIRDEAHRFAHSYQLLRRNKKFIKSKN